MRDGIALRQQFVARVRGAEEFVSEAARPGIGRCRQDRFGFVVVQGIVEPRDRTRGITERRMGRHVRDLLTVDIDFATIAQAFENSAPLNGRFLPAMTSSHLTLFMGVLRNRRVMA